MDCHKLQCVAKDDSTHEENEEGEDRPLQGHLARSGGVGEVMNVFPVQNDVGENARKEAEEGANERNELEHRPHHQFQIGRPPPLPSSDE